MAPARSLTFTLDAGAPSWAAITGNQLTLTPGYDDGGKIHNLVVRVSDGGSPTYGYSRLLAVIVNDVNRPPVLGTMATTYSVNEGDTVTFAATANDPDVEDAMSLRFSLAGAPSAATIDPATGQFSWITAEADGPGTFSFNVVVWDNHRLSAPLSDQQEMTVTVAEVNQSPTIQVSGATTIDEHQELVLNIRGDDADLPANTLTLSLLNVDPDISGYSFDPDTGEFRWTPGEEHGGGSYQFTAVVTDDASPTSASTQQTVTITVNEVNSPPVIGPLTMSPFDAQEDITLEITGNPDTQTVSFTAAAADPDIPVQSLTFSLAGVPAGTTNAPSITTTGDFSWTLTEDDGPATYNVTLRVTDSGGLRDERTFRVAVAVPRPTIYVNDVTVIEGGAAQFTVSLNKPGLAPVTVDFTTNDGTATATDDYVGASGTLTFAPGETTKTITIGTTADTVPEVDKVFSVDLSNAVGGDIDRAQGAGSIIDDDAGAGGWFTYGEASVTGNVVTVGVADRGEYDSQPYEFHGASVLLSPGANYTVAFDVDLATWDSYNELVNSSTGYWDSFSVSITPQPYPDLVLEDPVFFPFMWGGADYGTGTLETHTASTSFSVAGDPSGPNYLNVVMDTITPPSADGAFPSWGTVTITQMPALAEPQLSIQSATVGERNGLAYFVVRRTGDDSGVSSVSFNTIDGSALDASDYVATSGSLTFAAGEIVKLIAVPIINDKTPEPQESFSVELSGASGATLGASSANGTIQDDDPELTGELIYPPIAHDDGLDGGTYLFTVGHLETFSSSGSVLGNDVYYRSPQTFVLVSGTSHGALTFDPTSGDFTYDPDDTFAGIDTFTYKFIDGSLHSNVATVTIQVTNNPPVAQDDLYRVIVGGARDISAADGLLVNDWDTDSGDPLTVSAYSSKTGSPLGVLTVNSDGSFTYQADAAGVDEYLYYVYDGIDNSAVPGTLVINVLGVHVNIATDSNHSGGPADEADELVEEDEPGRLVVLDGELVDVVLTREFLDELNNPIAALTEADVTPELKMFKLTLAVPSTNTGEVRLWNDSAKSTEIPLGDYVYDGVHERPKHSTGVDLPHTVYAEGIKRGQVAIELIFASPSDAPLASDWLLMTVFDVDLDIDSFNDDGLNTFLDDAAEDQIEDASDLPGKFIGVNDADRDLDGVPDYADGYDLDSVPGNSDNALNDGPIFTPLIVRVAKKLDTSMATLTFTYDAGVPALIGREGTTYDTHAEDVYDLPTAQMRIWTAEGVRNKQDLLVGGQFVAPGKAYRLNDFSPLGGNSDQFFITLYVEGLRPSAVIGGDQISVKLNPLGANATASSPEHTDAVNTSIVGIDADVDSDNNNPQGHPDRTPEEDSIEEFEPGKFITITNDSALFAPYVVDISNAIQLSGSAAARPFVSFAYDNTKIQLWQGSVPLDPFTDYAISSVDSVLNLSIQGLPGLSDPPSQSTSVTATLKLFSAASPPPANPLLWQNSDIVALRAAPQVHIEWIGTPLGQGTNFRENSVPAEYGGGDAISPEKRLPGQREEVDRLPGWERWSKLYSTVTLRVTLDAPVDIYHAQVIILDPDHYSSDPAFDPNGITEPNDNLGLGPAPGARFAKLGGEGRLVGITSRGHAADAIFRKSTPTNAMGKPYVDLLVEIYKTNPTNNFIAIAIGGRGLSDENIRFASDGRTPQWRLSASSEFEDVPAAQKTKILSVTRTLFIEHDSMANPVLTQQPSPSVIERGTIIPRSIVSNTFKINASIDAVHEKQFVGGKITLKDASGDVIGTYDIADFELANNANDPPRLTLTVPVPATAHSFENLADDDLVHGVTAADMQVDLSLLQSRLTPAFIGVNYTKSDLSPRNANNVNQNDIPFLLNVGQNLENMGAGSLGETLRNILRNHRQSEPERDFWTVYVFGAYQGPLPRDGDHPILGDDGRWKNDTASGLTFRTASFVFRESIRDRVADGGPAFVRTDAQLAALTPLHEIGHIFGLAHDVGDGPIMDPSRVNGELDLSNLVFSGQGLRKIIDTERPGG